MKDPDDPDGPDPCLPTEMAGIENSPVQDGLIAAKLDINPIDIHKSLNGGIQDIKGKGRVLSDDSEDDFQLVQNKKTQEG